MGALLEYCRSTAYAGCEKKILNGGKGASYDLFSCSHNALQGLLVMSTAVTKPYCDAEYQDTLHCAPVEGGEDQRWEVGSSQSPQEVKTLLCLLLHRAGVVGLGEVIRDVHAEELGGSDSLYL